MKIALFLQFHDYQPRFAILDSDDFGQIRIERTVLDKITACPDMHQSIQIDGTQFPEDQWGIFGCSWEDFQTGRNPVQIDRFVHLNINFEG